MLRSCRACAHAQGVRNACRGRPLRPMYHTLSALAHLAAASPGSRRSWRTGGGLCAPNPEPPGRSAYCSSSNRLGRQRAVTADLLWCRDRAVPRIDTPRMPQGSSTAECGTGVTEHGPSPPKAICLRHDVAAARQAHHRTLMLQLDCRGVQHRSSNTCLCSNERRPCGSDEVELLVVSPC